MLKEIQKSTHELLINAHSGPESSVSHWCVANGVNLTPGHYHLQYDFVIRALPLDRALIFEVK